MATELSEDLVALLRKPLLGHVATVMPDGTPQSTPVWIDTDGSSVMFNTAKGRVKHRNLMQNPAVAISLVDDENPYRMVEIRGRAEVVEEGADDHIDAMAKKYLGKDSYPFRQPGEERVIVRVRPTAVAGA
ncbi:MAG: PPOX class F420-dependent oxidoreductase [Acidimicrobiales bacterium]